MNHLDTQTDLTANKQLQTEPEDIANCDEEDHIGLMGGQCCNCAIRLATTVKLQTIAVYCHILNLILPLLSH